MKRLLFDIVLNDKFSRNMKKIAGGADSSINKLNKSLTKTKPLSKNIDQLERKLSELRKAQRNAFSIREIKRYSSEIKKTSKELAKLERKGRTGKESSGGGMLGKAGLIGIGLGAVYGGVRLGKEIVDTTAKYERFEAVLKNSYGSGMKAKQVMSDLANFASKTPFQIDELTDSFVKLKNAGLEPTMAEMTNLGDLAASQGKSFGQLSEALLDAQMGEFERLKEFGIKGSTKGNKYQFIFKGQKTLVEKNSKAVKEYIMSLGKMKGVQGGMNAISKTTGGQLSNLADNWDQLKAVMGDANKGVIKDAIGGFSSLVAGVKDYMTVPLSEKMREEQYGLKSLIGVITDSNTSNEDRLRLLTQLKEEYPDFLGNLDAETASNEELLKRLDAVNASYEKRISLQSSLELQEYKEQKLEEAKSTKRAALLQLDLLKQAQAGDERAKEMLSKNMSTGDAFKLFATNYGRYMSGTVLFQGFKDKGSYYREQIAELEKVIAKTEEEVKKGDVKVTFDKLTTYLDSKNPNLDKLSGKDKERYADWMGQLKDQSKILEGLMKTKGFDSDSVDYKEKVKEINTLKSLISGLFEDTSKTGSTLKSTNLGNTRLLKDNVADIQGDNRVAKNLTINIDNMIEGGLNIVTNTLREGTAEMKQQVLEALLSAVNDVNGA